MNENMCADLADLLPEWVAGRLDASGAERVAAHVAGCPDCAGQADLLRALAGARPAAPAGFADRVARALAEDAPVRRPAPRRVRPAWAISAAAVLVLAVGTAVVARRASQPEPTEAPLAASVLGDAVEDEAAVWIVDDGAVAGAPVLDALSDEALATLAEEIGA